VPCVAGAEEDGGGEMWVGCSQIGSGTGAIGRRGWRDAVARERPKVKALW
jgi:hypothetical protein